MSKVKKDVIIELVYLLLFLAVVVVWGVSTVLLFVDYSTVVAIISVVSYFAVFIGVFLIEKHTNHYKWKYMFLGKKFKKQVNDFFALHPEIGPKEKKIRLKEMKKTYRQIGSIRFSIFYLQSTPYKIWSEDYYAFNYGNALDKHKLNYIIYCLQMNTDIGGGLYRFFESITEEPFTYQEYRNLISRTRLFSVELKGLLLRPKYEKIFEYFKKYDSLSDEEHKELEDFELNDSDLISEFDTELFKLVEDLAVKCYLEYKLRESLPPYAEKLYVSTDKTKRMVIYKDAQTGHYKVNRDNFVFYDMESSVLHSEGGWQPAPGSNSGSSFYETIDLAIKDNEKELDDLCETSL